MKKYGYIRVSSKDQNPDRQIHAMQKEGVLKKNIYIDTVSGKDFERPQYQKLLKKMKKGDMMIIKSIDRLGRNYSEILEHWRYLTKKMEVNIQVIDFPLLNTTTVQGNLTGVFISDLVLQILAYVAETERTFIRQRQAEGIAVALAKGVHFGCSKMPLPDEFNFYYEKWRSGEISCRGAAAQMGISYSTFYRRCKEQETTLIQKEKRKTLFI